jgi:hypothetical protein
MTVVAPPAIVSETIGDLFEEIGTREPDALAYVDGDQRLTYGPIRLRRSCGHVV